MANSAPEEGDLLDLYPPGPLKKERYLRAVKPRAPVMHPDGYEIKKGLIVQCHQGRHAKTNHAVVWYAEVVEVKVTKEKGVPIVEVVPFYTQRDLTLEYLAPSNRHRPFVEALRGPNQIVRGTATEHVWASLVHRATDVVAFDPLCVSLPILAPGIKWYRNDLKVEIQRGAKKHRVARLVELPSGFCTLQCKHGGHYAPQHQTARYCADDATWFHVDCLQLRSTVEFYRQNPYNGLPQWINWSYMRSAVPRQVREHFESLVCTPIQRPHPGFAPNTFLSFELLLKRFRALAADPAFMLPSTDEAYILWFTKEVQDHTLSADRPGYRWTYSFANALAPRSYADRQLYQCPLHPDHVI